jgi:hypothetical protein
MDIGIGMSLTTSQLSGRYASYLKPEHAKFLLHCDSDFADTSYFGNIPTLIGMPTIDTGIKIFGAGSGLFSITSGVSYPAAPYWNVFGSIPWQLSFRWFSSSARPNGLAMMFTSAVGINGNPGFKMRHLPHASPPQIDLFGTVFTAQWDVTIPTDVWSVCRFNHDGAGNYRMYLNGSLVSVEINPGGNFDSTSPLNIGVESTGTNGVVGNFDEILWEKHPGLIVTTDSTYVVENKAYEFAPATLEAPPVNPFSMMQLQLHLDSDFSDSSSNNFTPTLVGGVNIDTTKKVFGTGSMLGGVAKSVRYPASSNWDVFDGTPWQISFRWFNPSDRENNEYFFATAVSSPGSGVRFRTIVSAGQIDIIDTVVVRALWKYMAPTDVFLAVRFNFDGNNLVRLYVDGVLIGIRQVTTINDANNPLWIGNRDLLERGIVGNIDEFKWEKHASLEITKSPIYSVESVVFPDS